MLHRPVVMATGNGPHSSRSAVVIEDVRVGNLPALTYDLPLRHRQLPPPSCAPPFPFIAAAITRSLFSFCGMDNLAFRALHLGMHGHSARRSWQLKSTQASNRSKCNAKPSYISEARLTLLADVSEGHYTGNLPYAS